MSKGIKKREILFLTLAVSLFTVCVIIDYYSMLNSQTPGPAFEKIEIEGVNANNNRTLVITLDYRNTGTIKATVKNILIDEQPIGSYATFVDIYDTSGDSIKNMFPTVSNIGYTIHVGEVGKFVIVFSKDSFASGRVLNIGLSTASQPDPYSLYSTSCKVP